MGLRTKIKTEYFLGDSMKVIGELCHQLSDFDKLQNAEILSLISQELKTRPLPKQSTRVRPKAKGKFLSNYHSGNELVLSQIRKEATALNRIEIIYQMCVQIAMFDGLRGDQILSLIDCYLKEHIIEVDV